MKFKVGDILSDHNIPDFKIKIIGCNNSEYSIVYLQLDSKQSSILPHMYVEETYYKLSKLEKMFYD